MLHVQCNERKRLNKNFGNLGETRKNFCFYAQI
jgi:hypothetical protein